MKTLTTLMFSFLLIGTTFSQKFINKSMNDLTIKPKGDMVLDSVHYDKGTKFQLRKYFDKEGRIKTVIARRGYNGTEKRTKYNYTNPTQPIQLVDSVMVLYPKSCDVIKGTYWGIERREYFHNNPQKGFVTEILYPILAGGGYTVKVSTRKDSIGVDGRLAKSRLDSVAKDGSRIRWIYEYKYGELGTVQVAKFDAIFPQSRYYDHNTDTLEIKAYAKNYCDDLIEVDYFVTKTDTIVGYPFIFCLQPQPVPVFSQEQVVTTKDQYGNVLTASFGGHTATFYYSKSTNTSIFEIKADNGLKVCPTIITSTLNITDYNGLKTVSVFNLSGSLVHKEEVESNSIDLSFLSKGMYIVSIETETGISNHKIIKQ